MTDGTSGHFGAPGPGVSANSEGRSELAQRHANTPATQRRRAGVLFAWATVLLVASASADTAATNEMDSAQRRADAAAQHLTATLMKELSAAIADGGTVAAVNVCRQVAQNVTRDLGAREGITIRRTALRTRNPANAPKEWERVWLEQAEAAVDAQRPPQPTYNVITQPDGRAELRHLRPILFPGGLCSQCHGMPNEIPEEVRAMLREHYPTDMATGFRRGDLRGAISVRVPLTAETAIDNK